MFVSHKALNSRHTTTAFCRQVAERKRRRLEEEEARTGAQMAITVYGIPLYPFTSFKYIGKILMAEDNDWPAVFSNLRKARRKWAIMTRVLGREGEYDWTLGQIYLVVVQSVFLYGSETWFMTPIIGRVLGRFHQRVARRMTGWQPQQGRDSVWVYPCWRTQ